MSILALLSSDEAQRVLGQWMDRERVAFALCRTWFDKIYAPSERYLDGLRGDLKVEEVERFREAFDETEIAALERFHRFFELRIDMVPAELLDDGRIPLGDPWYALIKDAGYLLNDLGIDADVVRKKAILHLKSLNSADDAGTDAAGTLHLILHAE